MFSCELFAARTMMAVLCSMARWLVWLTRRTMHHQKPHKLSTTLTRTMWIRASGDGIQRWRHKRPPSVWNLQEAVLNEGRGTYNICGWWNNKILRLVGHLRPSVWKINQCFGLKRVKRGFKASPHFSFKNRAVDYGCLRQLMTLQIYPSNMAARVCHF